MADPDVPGPPSPGALRAAAVLVGLGPDAAAALFKLLGEAELRQIALGAKELRSRRELHVQEALRQFVDTLDSASSDALIADDLLRDAASRALGVEAARRAFDGVLAPAAPDEVLGHVALADAESLAMVLAREQPQTAALVLSSIESTRAAAVMDKLPEASRIPIICRMATIESVSPEVLREVGQALSVELKAAVAGGMRKVDGRSAALELLRRIPPDQQNEVVAQLEKDDTELAAEVRTKLFTFDDLANVSDRDIQQLLKDVPADQLPIALKGASPQLREKFLRNLSSRASQMLADDIAAMGAVRLAAVEKAQSEIAKLALQLSEQQRITLVRPTDRMV